MATVPLLGPISLISNPKPQSLYQNLSFPTQIPLQSIKTTKRLLKPLKITTKHTNFLHTKEHDSAANNRTLIKQFVDTMLNALQALQKPASVAIMAALFVYLNSHSAALAASGGRMGGSSFSSHSSDSSSSWSSSSSSSSWSSSSSSSSWSSSGSSKSYSHRSSSPPPRPPPFGFTLDRNGRYLGQRSYWTRTISPGLSYTVTVAQPKPAGPSFGLILLYTMGFGFCVIVIFSSISRSVRSGGSCDRPERIIADEMSSVVKIQVGLLGTATSLQRDLNWICETADTSTSMGLSYILQETTSALIRHEEYITSGYSFVDVKGTIEAGEKCFKQISFEECQKIDEETLVNVNNIKWKSTKIQRDDSFSNAYIVITIMVAVDGVHRPPVTKSIRDLKEALQKLGSISSRRIMAAEVLWTPQDENDTLSEQELHKRYPVLSSITEEWSRNK